MLMAIQYEATHTHTHTGYMRCYALHAGICFLFFYFQEKEEKKSKYPLKTLLTFMYTFLHRKLRGGRL